ncbi:unnamed protein product [Amoebophrya sp. A25]|nr:unnamed protein product [Amoebophrya sp. A25]|eukprot:GSA25T00008444001.1
MDRPPSRSSRAKRLGDMTKQKYQTETDSFFGRRPRTIEKENHVGVGVGGDSFSSCLGSRRWVLKPLDGDGTRLGGQLKIRRDFGLGEHPSSSSSSLGCSECPRPLSRGDRERPLSRSGDRPLSRSGDRPLSRGGDGGSGRPLSRGRDRSPYNIMQDHCFDPHPLGDPGDPLGVTASANMGCGGLRPHSRGSDGDGDEPDRAAATCFDTFWVDQSGPGRPMNRVRSLDTLGPWDNRKLARSRPGSRCGLILPSIGGRGKKESSMRCSAPVLA